VRQRVQELLGLDRPVPGVAAAPIADADVIRGTIRNADPVTAKVLADAFAEAYISVRREQSVNELLSASTEVQDKITELQVRIDTLSEGDPIRQSLVNQQATFRQTLDQLQVDAALRTGGASVIRPAFVPGVPIAPDTERNVMVALVAGLFIGLLGALALEHFDKRIRDDEDLARVTDLPVLGAVPIDHPPDGRPIAMTRADDRAVEAYRGLRTNLQFLGLDRPTKVVQVVSSVAGEGKTTTATNLAVVLAQAGRRVALVDADLRRPRIHEVFALSNQSGLTDLLIGRQASDVLKTVIVGPQASMVVVVSGATPPNPSELLSGHRMAALLAELAERYDHVIVDSAPVLPVTDSVALTRSVDAVLIVVQAGRATSTDLAEAVERLERVKAPVIGVVLNRLSASSRSGYGYGYGYGSGRSAVAPGGADLGGSAALPGGAVGVVDEQLA
jgi:capsular exopolysaccharide synthesis family protein